MDEEGPVIRVFVADDHTLFRDGIRALLSSISDVEVIGEAGTGADGVRQVVELEPHVVLMDIQMPDMNGIEATRIISAQRPDINVVMLTMFEDDDSVFAAMRAGARGYILKGADQAEMLRAIRAVASGEALFGPAIATRILSWFSGKQNRPPEPFPDLTQRERELLEMIAEGKSNGEMANRLSLSGKTVRNHISNIFSKLQVAGRAEAIVRAREAGMGSRTERF